MLPTDSRLHERPLDRRAALGAFGALGVLALGFPQLASAANRVSGTNGVPVWRLDAVHQQGPGGKVSGCAGCHACRSHARNRVFATRGAAAEGKAHAGCKCRVVRTSMPRKTFERLFGPVDQPERVVVDRRWAKPKRVLNSAGSK